MAEAAITQVRQLIEQTKTRGRSVVTYPYNRTNPQQLREGEVIMLINTLKEDGCNVSRQYFRGNESLFITW